VVICSAHSDYDWCEVVARLHHSDKLLVIKKPFEPIEVLQSANALTRKWQNELTLRRHVENLEHVVEARTQGLEAANRQLRHLATHDALTGLPNRVLLDDRLTQAMAHAQRDGQGFAVAMFDWIASRMVNDSFGHHAGDQLIKRGRTTTRVSRRTTDTVARLGGDEFLIIVDKISRREDAEEIARRAAEALQAPIRLGDVDIHTFRSIGIAFYPADGQSVDTLIANADAAMYCAKQRGRKQHSMVCARMNSVTQEKVKLESDLHGALRVAQFELHYQPKVDHSHRRDSRRGGAGSLATSRAGAHFTRGVHPVGRGVRVDRFHRRVGRARGLSAGARLATGGLAHLRVAVNLSAFQFRHGNLLHMIRSALHAAEAGSAPARGRDYRRLL